MNNTNYKIPSQLVIDILSNADFSDYIEHPKEKILLDNFEAGYHKALRDVLKELKKNGY